MNLIEPFGIAWHRMVVLLFRPFDLGKWFLLGFSAFLASFLTGGTNFSFRQNWPSSNGHKGLPAPFDTWGADIWIPVISGAAVVIVALMILLIWLGSRGQFMLLDNVVKGGCEVRAPWREFRVQANSLFKLYALAFGAWLLLFLFLGGIAAAYFFMAPRSFHSWSYYIPYVLCILVLFLFSAIYSIALFFVREFGVLWMYRHGGSAWDAARKVTALGGEHTADFLLYLCLRLALGLAIILVTILAGCLTCCIGFLPYLSSVITLPLSVFRVWYSVECFASLGPDCDVRTLSALPPPVGL